MISVTGPYQVEASPAQHRDAEAEFGIVANVLETDRVLRAGAKCWLTGLWASGRYQWFGLSRGGRAVEKWAPITRFHKYRAAWVPEHLRDRVWFCRGTRAEMEAQAVELETFAKEERQAHPNRRQ